ncbi:unnamed protein product [Withania somnifera]
MADELQTVSEAGKMLRKRKMEHKKKGGKGKKKQKGKMKKLFKKRARDYYSDNEVEDDNDVEPAPVNRAKCTSYGKEKPTSYIRKKPASHGKQEDDFDDEWEDDGEEHDNEESEISKDEDGEVQPGITKFIDGCNAFRLAFKKIPKKSASDDILIREKGHVKPANFLDSHEKAVLEVATKGVVKLFNAISCSTHFKLDDSVNKAQHAQKALNPSRAKDDKALKKRRREVFFSQLGKTPSQTAVSKAGASNSSKDEGPSWAPLRDNYMLTNAKLKDWDKNPDATAADDMRISADSDSSDDE